MIDIPYKVDDSRINKYDKIMTEAGFHLFEAEMLLDTFIKDVINENDEKCLNFEIVIPNQKNGGYSNLTINRIFQNHENSCIEILVHEFDNAICWDELNVTAKNLIANYIHLNLLSDEIYDNLRQH